MKLTLTKSLAVLAMVISLGACQNLDKKQQNTAVGGVAGNLIFGGAGATLGGAALGGVIGSQVK